MEPTVVKIKLFNDSRKKEKEIFLKRKNEIDEKMEKTKKYLNVKLKHPKDYLFYKYQEEFENNQKKLLEKVNMDKKEPLVTQEQLKELAEKIQQQKQYLQDNAEEKRKQLKNLWNFRSQTLPTYHNPMMDKIEEEKLIKLNEEEDKRRAKESNQLEKINYKPPSVKINKSFLSFITLYISLLINPHLYL